MSGSNVILEKRDRVATVTLNRPEAINSLSASMLHDLKAALDEFESDDEVDVMILTAAGTKGFCAGMDLKDFESGKTDLAFTKRVLDQLEDLTKPTIGAVTDGFCITGGLELALCCDFLVASERAVFADTHSRINVSGGGAAVRMPRLIGLMRAKYMVLTSKRFDAHTAKAMGLVVEVFPSDSLQDEARAIASEILEQDQSIARRMKQLMNRGWRTDLYGAWSLEEAECLRSMQMQMAKGFSMRSAVKSGKTD